MAEPKPRDDQQRDEQNVEFDNFQRLLRGVLSAPKEEVDKKRAEYERDKKRRAS